MRPWRHEILTLEALLADPLTRLVMRSDNITVEETARAFQEAGHALVGEAARVEHRSWHRVWPPQCG